MRSGDWKPGDWWPCFSPATTNTEAVKQAAAKLDVSEKHVEILRTGGGVLTRVRQKET